MILQHCDIDVSHVDKYGRTALDVSSPNCRHLLQPYGILIASFLLKQSDLKVLNEVKPNIATEYSTEYPEVVSEYLSFFVFF